MALLDRQSILNQIALGVGFLDLEAHDVIIRIKVDLAIIHAATSCHEPRGPLRGRYTDVWVRSEHRWLCVAAQVARF